MAPWILKAVISSEAHYNGSCLRAWYSLTALAKHVWIVRWGGIKQQWISEGPCPAEWVRPCPVSGSIHLMAMWDGVHHVHHRTLIMDMSRGFQDTHFFNNEVKSFIQDSKTLNDIHTARSSDRPHCMNLSFKKSVSERGAFWYRLFGILPHRVGLHDCDLCWAFGGNVRPKPKHSTFSPSQEPCWRVRPPWGRYSSMSNPRGYLRFKDYYFGMFLRWFDKNKQETNMFDRRGGHIFFL